MHEEHAVDIGKHVRIYITVFAALLALTVITVIVSWAELSTMAAVVVALFIATVKGGLVACYFMHLISERKLILNLMLMTIGLFVVLLLLPLWSHSDQVGDSNQPVVTAPAHEEH